MYLFSLFVFTGESSDSEGETTKLWNQIHYFCLDAIKRNKWKDTFKWKRKQHVKKESIKKCYKICSGGNDPLTTNSSNPEVCSEANCWFKAVNWPDCPEAFEPGRSFGVGGGAFGGMCSELPLSLFSCLLRETTLLRSSSSDGRRTNRRSTYLALM